MSIQMIKMNNPIYAVVSNMFKSPLGTFPSDRLSVLGFTLGYFPRGVSLSREGLTTRLEVSEKDNTLYVGSDGRTYKVLEEAIVGLFEPHLKHEINKRL